MGDGVERVELNLFFVGSFGFVEFVLLLQSDTEVVVGVFVECIHANLLAKCISSFVEIAGAKISKAQIVPGLLVLGVEFYDALEKWNGGADVAGIERREACLE